NSSVSRRPSCSHTTLTLFLPRRTSPSFTPSRISRPCSLVKIFQASRETDSSAAGRNSGKASSTVTAAPSRRHTLPSSRPITPAPMTPSFCGTVLKSSAPTLSHTSSLSISTPGRVRGLEPVAITTCFACTALPATSNCQPCSLCFTSRPWPCSQLTLFFLNRNSIPPVILLTIASLRAIILGTSMLAPLTSMPCRASPLLTWSYSSEDCSSALAGLHPTLRQVPPSTGLPAGLRHASTQAVLNPSCAARIAQM